MTPLHKNDETTVNKLGLRLDDYRNVIEEKAIEYSFNVIDGRKLEINHNDSIEKREYIFDGVHPMPVGHYLYARLVYNAIIGEKTYGITTDKNLEVVKVGEQTRISARIASRLPKKSVTWNSSNENVATVKNGVVTALTPGTAVITAKACTGETVPFICVVEPIYESAKQETFYYNGYEATVLIPENFNGKWVWKTEFMYAFDKSEQDLYNMGYARVYYAISDKYGSPDAVRLMHEFYLELMRRYTFKEKCYLFGFSRGALYAFNFALEYPRCVEKMYLDAPVLDLRSWPRTNPKYDEIYLHEQVMTEYGFKSETEFLNYQGYPVGKLKEYFNLKIPTLLIAGDSDTTVAFSENSQFMIDYCKENGVDLTYYVKVGDDHHPHSFGNIKTYENTYAETFNVYSSEFSGSSKDNTVKVESKTSYVIDFIVKQ